MTSEVSQSNTLRELIGYQASLSNRIDELLVETDGEIVPEIENLMQELTRVETETLPAKVDAIRGVIDRSNSLSDRYAEYEALYYRLKKGHQNVVERLKSWVKVNMQERGLREMVGHHFSYRIARTQASLEVNPKELPDEYFIETVTRVPDKDRIRFHLEQGVVVPGARLIESYALRASVKKSGGE
jgi:hypothetical protein